MAETMRTAVCTGPGKIDIEERPVPTIDADKLLVRVEVCGICGSDLAVWRGTEQKYPYSPGHEFSGIIEKVGPAAEIFFKGQRVVINPNLGCGDCSFCERGLPNLCSFLKSRPIKSNGGFADFVAVDYRMAHPLPDEMTDEQATYIEPLSCALHVVNTASIKRCDRVAVFGGGMLGLLTGLSLTSKRKKYFIIEPLEKRRRHLEKIFDISCFSPTQFASDSNKESFSIAIDCSGNLEAISLAVKLISKAGTLVLAGLAGPKPTAIPFDEVTKKELNLKGSWLNPDTFIEAIELAGNNQALFDNLATKTFDLSAIKQAFECAAGNEYNKVFVRP
jgi:threonine dehydrogenase-like Zn-dependent dehydrogenase